MKSIKLGVFVFVVILLMSFQVQAAEDITSPSGIANRLAQNEVFSPFQVMVERSGKLTIEPKSVFFEGTQNPEFELPQLLTKLEPISLPSWMLTQKWEGEVVLALAVKTDGTVSETMIMKTSGNETLDRWATELIQSWQFLPAMRNGETVYECIQIPIVFKLEPIE